MASHQKSAPLRPANRWYSIFHTSSPPRLGIDFGLRLPLTSTAAFITGMGLGFSHGSTKAAFQYRAENAHRFPTSSIGWYQYHRTKSYKSIVGGVKDGMKLGMKLGAGAITFSLFEETVDHARNGRRDFLSTVTAGLSFSGVYSLLARHDIYTAARTAKLSLKLSLAYGLIQDVLATMKGNRPRYVEFLVGKVRQTDALNEEV
ncbi:hypothetical protein AJ80_09061 [Polytolypa hystricis UAMH7299]|uniref:Mitochondrial import inner membrane translocase subunit TIM22 n=1 Tax=Polytolypa hystricis (strain UAMH7299) TaxID=1447883 RepID=A0A2B7WXB6_POLH7|nr:hypothetical protein AJ80_09061 [Polytolypa hystricis UAMH7299]